MRRWGLLLYAILLASATNSQMVFRGKVIDKASREGLDLASIKIEDQHFLTDKSGDFSIKVQQPSTAIISYVGYESVIIPVSDSAVVVGLSKGTVDLSEVTIANTSPLRSFHAISKIDINLQPVRSSQDIMRIVPGLFIGQHQGGGKAEQIFLRGFDIDHGTDIHVSVDGLPVNMVSHAHGQGYADLHFVIPELVSNIDYGKGPYYSNYGNLGTAGYVSLNTLNSLDKNVIKLEGGQFNTFRGVAMIDLLSNRLKEKGTNAYIASEYLYSDGPFDAPQHFNRFNLQGKFNTQFGINKLTVMASTLSSDWDASGQVPERAVKSGQIDRFGFIDSTEGGYTSRTNISAKLTSYFKNESNWENQVYHSKYNFNLHSNFTFYLNDPVNGDQIRQRESRDIYGYHSRFSHRFSYSGWEMTSAYGAGFRLDQTSNSELSHTINRNEVLSYDQLGDIRELNAFAYVDEVAEKGRWLINFGARFDQFNFLYNDKLTSAQQPSQNKSIVSPKINIQYSLNDRTQLYWKAGKGFHSNDARVVVFNRGENILPAAYGSDLGILIKPLPRLLINAAVWYLYLQQEFVYVGDEGIIEPSGRTQRTGSDVSGRYQFNSWLFADINLNYAHPRSMDAPKGEDYIPLAPNFTSTGGVSCQLKNGIRGSIRYRYMADRAANETNSITANGYTVTDLSLNYKRKNFEAGVSIENLFNIEWNETQFLTESRLKNEPLPVEEIHFTPGVPFFARLKFAVFF